jgi:competence protein ComEA
LTLDLRDRAALALGALAVVLLGAAAWQLLTPGGADAAGGPAISSPAPGGSAAPADAGPASTGMLVIDVEGAVVRPGVVTLREGARVADAIRAAGGYAPDADLAAAARDLNLAAPLMDGAQVYVPIQGVADEPGPGGGDGSGAGGLVNLNTASPEALDALPGIGPVTVEKIVAARDDRPFASLDELVDRKVMNRGQLDGIRDLVTI